VYARGGVATCPSARGRAVEPTAWRSLQAAVYPVVSCNAELLRLRIQPATAKLNRRYSIGLYLLVPGGK
jgi:hypothetical protein